ARRGVPRYASELAICLLLFALAIGFIISVFPLILDQATVVTSTIARFYAELRSFLLSSPSNLLRNLGFQLPLVFQVETIVQETAAVGDSGATAIEETADRVAQVFDNAMLAGRVLFSLTAVFLMAFYWTLESDVVIRVFLFLVPSRRREDIRMLVQEIETRVGGYLLGQALLMLIIGALQLVAYLLIGLPNALLLALIAGLAEAVPLVGPTLGAVPAILVALGLGNNTTVILVIISTVIVQGLENYLIVPRVMGRSVGTNPLVTLLFLAAFSSLMGLVGAILAIPTAAVLQILLGHFVFGAESDASFKATGRGRISVLRFQAQEIALDARKQLRFKQETQQGEQMQEEIEALAAELDRLLERSGRSEEGVN
ncbi:MAG TPA: AI-2E family transporter, partial [Anaerolineales bacterium]|nr:AI-2E family transporter [Anaerolineales bacterium]